MSRFIVDYGFTPRYTRQELNQLPFMLENDEMLVGMIEAHINLVYSRNINAPGLIAATDQRVLFLTNSVGGDRLREGVSLSKVTALKLKTTKTKSTIEISTIGTESSFFCYNSECCLRFYQHVQSALDKPVNFSEKKVGIQKVGKFFLNF